MPARHSKHLRISLEQGISQTPINSHCTPSRQGNPNGNEDKDVDESKDGCHRWHQDQGGEKSVAGKLFTRLLSRRSARRRNLQVTRWHEGDLVRPASERQAEPKAPPAGPAEVIL